MNTRFSLKLLVTSVRLVAGLVIVATMVSCAEDRAEPASDLPSLLLEDVDAVYRTELDLCMIGFGFESPISSQPLDDEAPVVAVVDYALGVSTRHFNASILRPGLLGETRPPPSPTVASGPEMSSAMERAFSEAMAMCTERASDAAFNALGSQDPVESEVDTNDLASKIAANPEVLSYEAGARRCVSEIIGAPFAAPGEAIEWFQERVSAIGPDTALSLSPQQMDSLAQLQTEEFQALAQLESCGWGDDYRDLIESVAEEVKADAP